MVNYKSKYLKYKLKYQNLTQKAGSSHHYVKQPDLPTDVNRGSPKPKNLVYVKQFDKYVDRKVFNTTMENSCMDYDYDDCLRFKNNCYWSKSIDESANNYIEGCINHNHNFLNYKNKILILKELENSYELNEKESDIIVKKFEELEKPNSILARLYQKNYSDLLTKNNDIKNEIETIKKEIEEINRYIVYDERFLE
tara:strand:+ start:64 stop:651 length:588 start_codon:yes stop_codon:yes gene_type:complete